MVNELNSTEKIENSPVNENEKLENIGKKKKINLNKTRKILNSDAGGKLNLILIILKKLAYKPSKYLIVSINISKS